MLRSRRDGSRVNGSAGVFVTTAVDQEEGKEEEEEKKTKTKEEEMAVVEQKKKKNPVEVCWGQPHMNPLPKKKRTPGLLE